MMSMEVGVRALVFLLLFYFSNSLQAEALKDPRTRDEDISYSKVSVDISKNKDDEFVYSYTVTAPVKNKGKIHIFKVDLQCRSKRTPARVSIGKGRATSYGITIDNLAMWGLYDGPGYINSGLEIISPNAPGLRFFSLMPVMRNSPEWDYPDEPDPSIPWLGDFMVTGMIPGPGCPGVTPPIDAAYFPGSTGQAGFGEVNKLLTYSEPMRDRWHTNESVKELTITVHYADNIDPKTFQVEPGWAQKYFDPKAGASQTIKLPLKQVKNIFKLRVSVDPNNVPASYGYYREDNDEFEVRRDIK